ncbi:MULTISPECIES: hypothetical protein [unclassified Curtobacterium]|uniref:hypothetical protein n=1 Tax=unclassified Curtobacterium TaxID=257496 RepID=UPI0015E8DFA4|nr:MULTISPECIES: hypothetical protein [unclassified Curtobacterium]WIB70968.1 hypothetical protein DEI85_00775 [Curtobacterium sp. MCBD17_026]
MPTFPEPVEDLEDLEDLDVEDAFGHPVAGTAGLPDGADGTDREADGGPLDDEGDVDDLDV